jgi:hypothetical protein
MVRVQHTVNGYVQSSGHFIVVPALNTEQGLTQEMRRWINEGLPGCAVGMIEREKKVMGFLSTYFCTLRFNFFK